MEESVTVSGQSPVVDVSTTTASVAFTKEVLDSIPRGRDLQNVFAMAPGVTQAVADVGGSTMAQRQNLSSYGVLSQPKLQVEGMNITMGADQNTAIYFNDSTLEEVQIKTLGQRCRGVGAGHLDGGDHEVGRQHVSRHLPDLHGIAEAPVRQPERCAAGAGPDRHLAAEEFLRPVGGSRRPDHPGQVLVLRRATGGSRRTKVSSGSPSSPGPDGKYLTADDPLANVETSLSQISAKLSYQLTKNNRLVYAWQRGTKAQPQNNAGRFTPLESTRDYQNPTAIQKVELQSMISPQLLVNAVAGYSGYVTDYDAGRSYARADAPPRQDLATTLNTGSAPLHQNKTRDRYPNRRQHQLLPAALARRQARAQGRHQHLSRQELRRLLEQPGLQLHPLHRYDRRCSEHALANPDLQHAGGARGPRQHLRRLPERQLAAVGHGDGQPRDPVGAAALVPPAHSRSAARVTGRPCSRPARTRQIDVQTLTRAVPRIGLAWDLGGAGVVKATFGLYNYMLGDTYADAFNGNATANAVFTWHDLNGDKLYEPGEVEPQPEQRRLQEHHGGQQPDPESEPEIAEHLGNHGELGARAGGQHGPPRDVRQQAGLRFDRQLHEQPGEHQHAASLRAPGAYRSRAAIRGPTASSATPTMRGSVTLYDYTAAYRGAAFVNAQTVNATNPDRYNSIEGTLSKRFSSRWTGQVSYFAVKNHRWISSVFTSPNDQFFPLDETWSWAGNITGSYRMPGDFLISGFLQTKNGVTGQRTYIFRQADPDGGPAIAQNGNTTLRVEPYGSQRLSAQNILNLRAARISSSAAGVGSTSTSTSSTC